MWVVDGKYGKCPWFYFKKAPSAEANGAGIQKWDRVGMLNLRERTLHRVFQVQYLSHPAMLPFHHRHVHDRRDQDFSTYENPFSR